MLRGAASVKPMAPSSPVTLRGSHAEQSVSVAMTQGPRHRRVGPRTPAQPLRLWPGISRLGPQSVTRRVMGGSFRDAAVPNVRTALNMFRGKTEPGPRAAEANWANALPRGSTVLLRGGFAFFAAMAGFAASALGRPNPWTSYLVRLGRRRLVARNLVPGARVLTE